MVGSIWDGRVFLYVQKLVQRHLVVLEQRGMHARCSTTTAVRELAATVQNDLESPLPRQATWPDGRFWQDKLLTSDER